MTRSTSFLNFFRGIAALWVVLAHCGIWGWGRVPDVLEPKKAVDLFMVISGFLMVYTIDRAGDREQPFAWSTWRKFYIRRFFRIAPAYYVALAIVFVIMDVLVQGAQTLMAIHPERWSSVAAGSRPDFSPTGLFLHTTFLFGLFPRYSAVSGLPAWSLSVEMQFYALFPLIYMAARRWSYTVVCVVLACISLLLARQYFHAVNIGRAPRFDEPSLLLFHFAKFATGMLIYEAGRLQRRSLLGAGALVLLVTARAYGPASALLITIVAVLANCWYRGTPHWAERCFKSKAVTLLSDTSYAVYLIHNMVIDVVGSHVLTGLVSAGAPLWVGEAALTLSVVVVAYPLAYVMYRTVEKTGIEWGKRAAHSSAPVAAPMT